MTFAADDILLLVEQFLLPFIRLGSFFLVAPIYGAQSVPVRIRLILAVGVTALIFPSMNMQNTFDAFSPQSLIVVVQEVLIGIAMGLILQFTMAAIVMSGHAIATAMGLGFASSADPQNGVQVTVVGQFYMILATLVFLAIDGHLVALDILANSFTRFPAGNFAIDALWLWEVGLFSTQMFVTGVLLALPVMTGVLLVNLAFGVMTRAAPQLNIFSIGFPMAMLAGFILMLLSLPVFMPLLDTAFTQTFNDLNGMFN
ncbi:MAG: flagellar biosynthetic protein FliR [Pseudomonadota bacterium]